jgi:hypothetical protein
MPMMLDPKRCRPRKQTLSRDETRGCRFRGKHSGETNETKSATRQDRSLLKREVLYRRLKSKLDSCGLGAVFLCLIAFDNY